MIKIQSLGSSSKGNCFILSDGITTIMLDVGIPKKSLKEKLFQLNYSYSDFSGIIITHHHQDHLQGISIFRSVKKYMTKEEFDCTNRKFIASDLNFNFIETNKVFEIGTFKIKAFQTYHDTPNPVGFIIRNSSGEKVVYITDTGVANKLIKDADLYLIESNHFSKEQVLANGEKGNINKELSQRITETHLSESQTMNYLKQAIGENTKAVILIHISPSHPDIKGIIKRFKKELDYDNIDYVNPKNHRISKEWKVGFEPKNKRSF